MPQIAVVSLKEFATFYLFFYFILLYSMVLSIYLTFFTIIFKKQVNNYKAKKQ